MNRTPGPGGGQAGVVDQNRVQEEDEGVVTEEDQELEHLVGLPCEQGLRWTSRGRRLSPIWCGCAEVYSRGSGRLVQWTVRHIKKQAKGYRRVILHWGYFCP